MISAKQFDNARPSWINTIVQSNLLADETGLVQWGVEDEIEYTTVAFDPPAPSSLWNWPSKTQPDNKYKIVSSYVTLTMDLNVIERQTSSLLEWLGDVGGLFDMLKLLGSYLIGPIGAFALRAELLTSVFRFTASLVYKERRLQQFKTGGIRNGSTLQAKILGDVEADEKTAAHM